LLRAVREAERQCIARKPKIKANEAKAKANRKDTLKKKWNLYNSGKVAWLDIKSQADSLKEEILSFEEIGTHMPEQISQIFNEEGKPPRIHKINARFVPHFADNILLNEIKSCLSKDEFGCVKIQLRTLEEEANRYSRVGIKDAQRERLLDLLQKYVSLQERYLGSKTNFNKNKNRNAYYEYERHNREASRANELEGLF
jgi:hypothetical protein